MAKNHPVICKRLMLITARHLLLFMGRRICSWDTQSYLFASGGRKFGAKRKSFADAPVCGIAVQSAKEDSEMRVDVLKEKLMADPVYNESQLR